MFWKRALWFFVFTCIVAAATPDAENTVLHTVISPREPATPGAVFTVQIATLNPSAQPVTIALPATLNGRLISGNSSSDIRLEAERSAEAQPVTIAAGGFVLRTYSATISPEVARGPADLELTLPDGASGRAAFAIAEPETTPGSNSNPDPAARLTTNLARPHPAAEGLRRMFADRLGPHQPIYFIYGPDDPAAKFQFSFKYKLLDFQNIAPQRMARTLQFAFTQLSLWDIEGESSPFYDTSYMPELMYESLAPAPEDGGGWFTWLGFQAAYRHESNGRDAVMSRSLNVVYARPVFAIGPLDRWHLLVIPEVFAYIGTRENNPFIQDYRGHGKLSLVFGRNEGPSLMASAWAGDDFENVSVQLDLTLPLRTELLDFGTYFLVQYFRGYGESLLFYRERSETIRAGISFVR
jgi:outer membrane phospholipase A